MFKKADLIKLINEKNTSMMVEVLVILLVLFIGYLNFTDNTYDLSHYNNGDMHRGFERGIDVLTGTNSYSAFNPNNLLTQEKVPGFFPLYFMFMAAVARISNYSFVLFINNFRLIIFLCYSALGVVIYKHIREKNKIVAILSMVIFMFNRWTLMDVLALKQEAYVLLILAISLFILPKNKGLSYLLFGVATALKHLTILILPLYVYDLVLSKGAGKGLKKKFIYILLLLTPIILPSIPYLVQTPKNFVNAILFNVTREAESGSDDDLKTGFDKMLILYNQDNMNFGLLILPRLPMLTVLVLINFIFVKKLISMWEYIALTYCAFIAFNPTVFGQYFSWFFFFLSLALKDRINIQINKNKTLA